MQNLDREDSVRVADQIDGMMIVTNNLEPLAQTSSSPSPQSASEPDVRRNHHRIGAVYAGYQGLISVPCSINLMTD
jgi:hypothetical protein